MTVPGLTSRAGSVVPFASVIFTFPYTEPPSPAIVVDFVDVEVEVVLVVVVEEVVEEVVEDVVVEVEEVVVEVDDVVVDVVEVVVEVVEVDVEVVEVEVVVEEVDVDDVVDDVVVEVVEVEVDVEVTDVVVVDTTLTKLASNVTFDKSESVAFAVVDGLKSDVPNTEPVQLENIWPFGASAYTRYLPMGSITAVPFMYFTPLITMPPLPGTVSMDILNMPLLGGDADCTETPVDL